MVTIRPVMIDDRSTWDALFAAYAAFYQVTLPEGAADTVWGWIHDPAEPFWADVALSDAGAPVGLVQYQAMHRSLGGSRVIYLSDLYVQPDIRGGGIGKALIDHVLAFAAREAYPNVRWLTQEFNYSARMLYDRYGPKSDFILYAVPVPRSGAD